ncbi:MAG: type II toxin-antitoxin system Phd/YefM family antitoxin [Propionibacteriaceae bacterium]|nr:type II toxin-antitoxin system Phd/YefM family antitoxin [Propionibacteriaceae bacterium]
MKLMTISDARASLAEVVDQVRVGGEPIYLTRRDQPVAVVVDVSYFTELLRVELPEKSVPAPQELERRLAAMEGGAAEFADWAAPGARHPASASDLYASRAT